VRKPFFGTRRRRTYVQSVLTGYLYTGVNVGINLALIPILVTRLGKEDYGIWLTIVAFVQWGAIGTGWLAPGFIKRIGDHLARNEFTQATHAVVNTRRLYRAIELAVLALAVVLATRPGVSVLGGEITSNLRVTILLATVWLMMQIESQIEVAILTAAQRLYVVYAVQAAVLLASGLAAGGLVVGGFGLPAVAASYATAATIGLLAYKMSRRRSVTISDDHVRFDFATIRDILSTTAPYALSIGGWILLSSDIILLAFLTSPVVVATYGIAYKMVDTMLQVIWRITDATQPYFIELDALGDRPALRRLYARTNEASLILGGSFAAALFFLGHRFLEFWVGAGQAADLSIVRLLCVYAVLQTFVHGSVIVPFSTGRMKTLGRLQLLEGVGKIALAVVLVPALGSAGVVVATLIAIVGTTGWYAPALAARLLDFRPGWFLARIVYPALPLPMTVGAAAYLGSKLIDGGSPPVVAVVGAAAIVALGALMTVRIRSMAA
jgi:O-antigen/teichoic acid export membrane protein